MSVEARLRERALILPEAMQIPGGGVLPFAPVKVRGNVARISGHIAQNSDGSIHELRGRVGSEVTLEQAQNLARIVGLSILGSLKREISDLDRIETWVSAFGMVNTAPDFHLHPMVINGFSDLILDLFGPEQGSHTRSAIGVAGLPFNSPVEVEAIVELKTALSN